MTLLLTPPVLMSAYDFLNETDPFCKWNLPQGEDVVFHIAKGKTAYGRHWHDGKRHHLEVSSGLVRRTATLIETMAHEMIHVHDRHAGTCRPGVDHGRAFRKWAAMVCEAHGFDLATFV